VQDKITQSLLSHIPALRSAPPPPSPSRPQQTVAPALLTGSRSGFEARLREVLAPLAAPDSGGELLGAASADPHRVAGGGRGRRRARTESLDVSGSTAPGDEGVSEDDQPVTLFPAAPLPQAPPAGGHHPELFLTHGLGLHELSAPLHLGAAAFLQHAPQSDAHGHEHHHHHHHHHHHEHDDRHHRHHGHEHDINLAFPQPPPPPLPPAHGPPHLGMEAADMLALAAGLAAAADAHTASDMPAGVHPNLLLLTSPSLAPMSASPGLSPQQPPSGASLLDATALLDAPDV
jgi:hypothetical protein